jgi:hypothetical protein
MKESKSKDDGKATDLPPKKLGVEQEEAVKGGALSGNALTLLYPDRFP